MARTRGASVVWTSVWTGLDRVGWPIVRSSSGCVVLARPLTATLGVRTGQVTPHPQAGAMIVVSVVYALGIRQIVLWTVRQIAPNSIAVESSIGQGLDWTRTIRLS